jgi:predicted Na+-dependent transporter
MYNRKNNVSLNMRFIQRYFGILLLISCLIGMVVPSVGDSTSMIVILSLAFIIFCSFFQINFTAEFLVTDFAISIKFWFLRYVIIPIAVYFAFKWISNFYALVLLLTFLLPAALSYPSFSVLFGGKPDLSLKILVYSSFLAVLTIPFLMRLLLSSSINVSTGKLLLTMVYTIIIPFILHLPLRKVKPVREVFGRYNSLLTLIGLCSIFVVVTARNKPAILGNPKLIGLFAVEALILYSVLYLVGFFLFPSQPADSRKTFSISSGANNIGLGVTLTALFFPGEMNIFFIVSQLAWVVMLIPLKRLFGRDEIKN